MKRDNICSTGKNGPFHSSLITLHNTKTTVIVLVYTPYHKEVCMQQHDSTAARVQQSGQKRKRGKLRRKDQFAEQREQQQDRESDLAESMSDSVSE